MSASTRWIAPLAFALWRLHGGDAWAQGGQAAEPFSFELASSPERGAAVSGELRLPQSTRARMPVVLILHSSPGFDGRGALYAEALNKAGIATVEIDYLRGKGMPASPRDNLPHAYETLGYLARHPRIDPARVGIMGFSWGGILALLTSSAELTQRYTEGKLRFAAHLGMYPICWTHHAILRGESKWFNPSVYQEVTDSPVHILAGEKDAFDNDPDTCANFVAALPQGARTHFSLTVYQNATFAWDSRFGSATYDIGVNRGKGGISHVTANPEVTSQSREFVVTFFRNKLGAD